MLVSAYTLFADLKQLIPAKVYANQTINDPDFETLLSAAADLEYYTTRTGGSGHEQPPSLDGLLRGAPQCISTEPSINFCVYANGSSQEKLQGLAHKFEEDNEQSSPTNRGKRDKKDFQQSNDYNGVLPIPPLDAYIFMHKLYLSAAASRDHSNLDPAIANATGGAGGFDDQTAKAASFAFSGEFDNILRLGALIFSPDTPEVWSLVQHLNSTTRFFGEYFGGVFENQDAAVEQCLRELDDYIITPDGEIVKRTWAMVHFDEIDVVNGHVDYTIRMNFSALPSTKHLYMSLTPILNTEYKRYYTSGFLSIQHAIATYFLNTTDPLLRHQPGDPKEINRDFWINLTLALSDENGTVHSNAFEELTIAAPFPTPEVELDLFFKVVGPTASVLLGLSTIFTLSRFVKSVVDEKEKQLRLLLEMMGLVPSIFGLSWLLTYMVIYAVIGFLVTIILKSSFMSHVNFLLLLTFIGLYELSQVGFGLMVAAMFNRAKIASIVGPLLLFSFLLPRYAFYYAVGSEQVSSKLWVSIFSPTAFSFGVDIIFAYGAAQAPLTWGRAWADELPFGGILLMLLLDSVVYIFVAWLIDFLLTSQSVPTFEQASHYVYSTIGDLYDQVGHASGFGQRRDFELVGLESNVNQSIRDLDLNAEGLEDSHSDALGRDRGEGELGAEGKDSKNGARSSNSVIESVPSGLEAIVNIQNLRKVYERGCGASLQRTVAVDSLSLSLYRGQITCLLGHNGAGKTTTISMLTGMLKPTAGNAKVNGLSITSNQLQIRQTMGVCPQHDILWEDLSVEAHLKLFATLKGVPPEQLQRLCYAAAEEVSLAGRGWITKAKSLSGGMKRKLCVAIAFMGNPSIVYLDEPTSGMDPYSRRYVWNLLRGKKPGRAVVLTTHFMDEAELLADRIAIMASGKLNCCGSALFLKSRSGIGYTLTTVAAAPEDETDDAKKNNSALSLPTCDTKALVKAIQDIVPEASVLNIAAGEVSMRLPLAAVAQFADLFETLEMKKASLGISGFGVAITTLEEVFMQVCRGGHLANRGSLSSPSSRAFKPRGSDKKEGHATGGEIGGRPETNSGSGMEDSFGDHEDTSDNHEGLLRNGTEGEEENGEGELRLHAIDLGDPTNNGRSRTRKSKGGYMGVGDEKQSDARDSDAVDNSARRPSSGNGFTHISGVPEAVKKWGREFSRNTYMLTWKRAICAIRDLKALTYELIVPVVTICLVLLILKLNVNPAGPSILLGTELYAEHCADTTSGESVDPPEAIVSSASTGPWQQLGVGSSASLRLGSGFSVVNVTGTDSFNISHYLLQNVHRHNRKSSRIEAYVPNDTLTITVSDRIYDDGVQIEKKIIEAIVSAPHPAPKPLGDVVEEAQRPGSLQGYGSPKKAKVAWHGKVPATILHNTTYYHALPLGLSELHQARLRAQKGPDAYVKVRNHPLPLTKIASMYIDTVLTLFAAIFLLLPFCYLPGTLAMFWVREKELHVKHVHFVSGVTPLQYWLSALCWDVLTIAVIDAVFIFVLIGYGNDEFIGTSERAWATYMLVFAYGLSVSPLSFLLSFGFNSASSAQVGIAGFHFVSGFVLLIVSNILEAIPSTYELALFLKSSVFRMLPPFVLGEGLINLSLVSLLEEVLGTNVSPWEYDVLGRSMMYLFLSSVMYLTIVIGLDSRSELRALIRHLASKVFGSNEAPRRNAREMTPLQRGSGDSGEVDVDVRAEKDKVKAYLQNADVRRDATGTNGDRQGSADVERAAIVIDGLVKIFPPLAVDELHLMVPKRQCFGLLGVNGAGKSTTLKVLTADVEPSFGQAYVNGISVREGVRAIRKQLGYCPQFNPLLPAMTVSETLWLYARFRGLDVDTSRSRISKLVKQLRLEEHEHKRCGALSGGNKRKVSLAIALVGDPPVLFLDEPSSGMDPVTRRYMWDLIAELGRRRCVVLTTHSMEECEALCHRIGIMSKGKLRCLGTLQRLKNRHGKGYHVEVSCPEANADRVLRVLSQSFPGLVVLESWGGKLKLRLQDPKVPLASMFRILEGQKKRLGIEDYSISQSSLEQIFISMVRDTFDEGGSSQAIDVPLQNNDLASANRNDSLKSGVHMETGHAAQNNSSHLGNQHFDAKRLVPARNGRHGRTASLNSGYGDDEKRNVALATSL